MILNSLHVKFFSKNIKMYLQFLSFLHTNMTQVVEIVLISQYQGFWWPGDTRSQGISNHDSDLVKLG